MKKKRKGTKAFMIRALPAVLVFLAVACAHDRAPAPSDKLEPQTAAQRQEEDQSASARRVARALEGTWSYNPTGKRNPFEVKPRCEDDPDCIIDKDFDLEEMWLDGIIKGPGREMAHIRLPDKGDLYVKVGDNLGLNNGRVSEIGANHIVIEEIYVDPSNPSEIHIIEKKIELRESKTGRK